MDQKFIQVGSSIGLVISKPLAEEKGIRKGDKFRMVSENGSNRIIIEPLAPAASKAGNPELVAWAEDAVERYRLALEALKDK